MGITKFLYPSRTKIEIFIVLFFFSHLVYSYFFSEYTRFGYPLEFYSLGGSCPPETNCTSFDPLLFIIDVSAWYLVSCFVTMLISRLKD